MFVNYYLIKMFIVQGAPKIDPKQWYSVVAGLFVNQVHFSGGFS